MRLMSFHTCLFYRERYVILVVTDVRYLEEVDEVDVRAAYAFDKDTGEDVEWRDVYDANYHYVDARLKEFIENTEVGE